MSDTTDSSCTVTGQLAEHGMEVVALCPDPDPAFQVDESIVAALGVISACFGPGDPSCATLNPSQSHAESAPEFDGDVPQISEADEGTEVAAANVEEVPDAVCESEGTDPLETQ
ncbi:hypothetical protein C8Q74DRAFT_1374318 [Fomes fomentarius]|nr:hypothetical protein C8Q74DRAFT_1374318 [Fomes fomentarius]